MNQEDWGFAKGFGRSRSTNITRLMIRKVLRLCGASVTHINFSGSKGITASKGLFQDINRLCPNLTGLNLEKVKTDLKVIECLGTNLTEFVMANCKDFEGAISLLFDRNKNLRFVKLLTVLSGDIWIHLNPLAIEKISLKGGENGVYCFRTVSIIFFSISLVYPIITNHIKCMYSRPCKVS